MQHSRNNKIYLIAIAASLFMAFVLAGILIFVFGLGKHLITLLETVHGSNELQFRLFGTALLLSVMSLFAVLGHKEAEKKNRNTYFWIFICFFFQLVPYLILRQLPKIKPVTDSSKKQIRHK